MKTSGSSGSKAHRIDCLSYGKTIARFFSGLFILFILTGCGPKNAPEVSQTSTKPIPAPKGELHVAAAADLTKAFAEIGAAFEAKTGQKVVFSFGASGQLAQQIAAGAPFDVFAAANESYIDKLAKDGKVKAETKHLYAIGQLALWTKKSVQPAPQKIEDLASSRFAHIAIANPEHAPYGKAAQEAMETAKLWTALKPKIVYGENVQQAFQYAQSGNADAALISHALTIGTEGSTVLVPPSLYKPLRQAMAVVQGAKQPEAAGQFVDFVTGESGRTILQKYGFSLP